MNSELQGLAEHLTSLISDCGRFCFPTRDSSFQKDARSRLEEFGAALATKKKQAVACGNEDAANAVLSMEEMTRALASELAMWIALKAGEYDEAWSNLVAAQYQSGAAVRAHDIGACHEPYVERLHVLEQLVFPPQVFLSTAYIVTKSECSICGAEYGECEHVKGLCYMGEMCARIVKECEIQEVSIVKNPADKRCRVTSFSDGPIQRDTMTWLESKKKLPASNEPQKT